MGTRPAARRTCTVAAGVEKWVPGESAWKEVSYELGPLLGCFPVLIRSTKLLGRRPVRT